MSGILTLSGWTQPAHALSHLIEGAESFDYSDYATPDAAIAALRIHRGRQTVVAWSTGGWLAMQAIAAGTLAPKSLLLIAPPFQFVNGNGFEEGMGPDTFARFRQNYIADPARTSARFHGLVAKGDRDMRAIMEKLEHHPGVTDTARWLPWLDALAGRALHDIRIGTPHITLIHGMNDAIVPVAQSAHIAARHPQMRLETWKDACHAPHLHDTMRFLHTVKALHAD